MSIVSGQDWEPVVLKKTNTNKNVNTKQNNCSINNPRF